jgi:hypothetical protein
MLVIIEYYWLLSDSIRNMTVGTTRNLFLSGNTTFQFETALGHLVVLNPILLSISTPSQKVKVPC